MATPPVKVHIKTTADTKGAKQTTRALDQVKSSAGATGSAGSASMGQLASGAIKTGVAMVGVSLAIRTIRKAIRDLTEAMRAGGEQEVLDAQQEAILRATGSAAGYTAEELSEMRGAMSELTGVSDELIERAQNLFLTFTQITDKGVFKKANEMALDMAATFGGDASSAAIQLGKALNDPILGLTALRKIGVSFNAQQKSMIKRLAESGDMLGAQTEILAELKREIGGTAEAAGKTLAGSMNRVKNATGDAKQAYGSWVGSLRVSQFVMRGVTDIARDLELAFKSVTATSKELKDETKEVNDMIADIERTLQGLDDTSIESAIDQAKKLGETYEDASKSIDTTLRRTEELAAAQRALKKAEVDRMVAAGEISSEEGRRRNIEIKATSEQAAIDRRRAALADQAAQVAAREASGELTPGQAAAERAGIKHAGSVFDLQSKTVGVQRAGGMAGVAATEAAAADRARLAGLQGDLSGAEDSLENLGSSPEAAAAIAEAGEASSARGALSRLEGSHQVDGRRMSTRSRGYRDELSRLHKQAADEQREADEALHQLGQLKGSLTQTIGQIKQEIETLNSQMRNAQ